MDFGDLRSLAAQVREQHGRVDELVYMLLKHQGGERFDEHVGYVLDILRDTSSGSVCLADLVLWALEGVQPLYARLGEEFEVSEGIVEEFLAGWVWSVVRRPDKAPYGVVEDADGTSSLYMYGSPTDAWMMHIPDWVPREGSGIQAHWDITVDDADWQGPPGRGRSSCRAGQSNE